MIQENIDGRLAETNGLHAGGVATPSTSRCGDASAMVNGDPECRGLNAIAVLGYN